MHGAGRGRRPRFRMAVGQRRVLGGRRRWQKFLRPWAAGSAQRSGGSISDTFAAMCDARARATTAYCASACARRNLLHTAAALMLGQDTSCQWDQEVSGEFVGLSQAEHRRRRQRRACSTSEGTARVRRSTSRDPTSGLAGPRPGRPGLLAKQGQANRQSDQPIPGLPGLPGQKSVRGRSRRIHGSGPIAPFRERGSLNPVEKARNPRQARNPLSNQ